MDKEAEGFKLYNTRTGEFDKFNSLEEVGEENWPDYIPLMAAVQASHQECRKLMKMMCILGKRWEISDDDVEVMRV